MYYQPSLVEAVCILKLELLQLSQVMYLIVNGKEQSLTTPDVFTKFPRDFRCLWSLY